MRCFYAAVVIIFLLLSGCRPAEIDETNKNNTPTLDLINQGATDLQLFVLPDAAGEPPSDILEHLVFDGVGGGEFGCPCINVNGENVALEGFKPNVAIRVVVYTKITVQYAGLGLVEGRYLQHWNITPNSDGFAQMHIEGLNKEGFGVLAFNSKGELESNSAISNLQEILSHWTEQAKAPCNTYQTHLAIGELAVVNSDPPIPNNVRQTFHMDSTRIGQIYPGELVEILDGPGCTHNGMVWWKIRSNETGLIGWTSEGDGKDYWLIPVD